MLKKLDGLRGFAAVYVVLHHSLPHTYLLWGLNIGNFLRFGQKAVICFFLLSGFVINYSFSLSKDKSFKVYIFKRFSRIYIPLVIVMLLGYIIQCVNVSGLADPEIGNLLLNLLMLQDISELKPNVIVDPYMMNAPLWSLSYEWWFYVMFFPIVFLLKSTKKQALLVYSIAIIAALLYNIYPSFILRVLMYASIWWAGVCLSNEYIRGSSMDFTDLKTPLLGLLCVCVILFIPVYDRLILSGFPSVGSSPFLEFRHHVFALLVISSAIMWRKYHWVGFDKLFSPFLIFAPISYVMYISHYYIIVDVSYLSFLNNDLFEWIGYMLILLMFSWVVEIVLYPKIRKIII